MFQIKAPDLPYVVADFSEKEPRHEDDNLPELKYYYFGCLNRREAFLFHRYLPRFNQLLFSAAVTTAQLHALHADPKRQPPEVPQINWTMLLEPYTFADKFPGETPAQVIFRTLRHTNHTNTWLYRLPYLLQCTRQITQLIQLFESFFQTLGFRGLREVVETIGLNTRIDFLHSMLLSTPETVYLTALYDILLREHLVHMAQQILRILHTPFPDSFQLATIRDTIIDCIDPPTTTYHLYEDDSDSLYN
jgi:hypothetical protein